MNQFKLGAKLPLKTTLNKKYAGISKQEKKSAPKVIHQKSFFSFRNAILLVSKHTGQANYLSDISAQTVEGMLGNLGDNLQHDDLMIYRRKRFF